MANDGGKPEVKWSFTIEMTDKGPIVKMPDGVPHGEVLMVLRMVLERLEQTQFAALVAAHVVQHLNLVQRMQKDPAMEAARKVLEQQTKKIQVERD